MIGLIVFFLSLVLYYVFLFLVIRFVFLYIRQFFRILIVRRAFKNSAKNSNIKVEPQRSVFKIMFGNKGDVDYAVTLGEHKYLISVISFPYGKKRLRWNIEKAVDSDLVYIEARFYSGFLYKDYKESSEEPNLFYQHKFETVFERHRLFLNDGCCGENAKKILLFVFPPEHLTYSDMNLKFLNSGDDILGYEVMFLNDLKAEIETILSVKNIY